MLELEENLKELQNLEEKLKELGESLWHREVGKRVKRIRRTNNE